MPHLQLRPAYKSNGVPFIPSPSLTSSTHPTTESPPPPPSHSTTLPLTPTTTNTSTPSPSQTSKTPTASPDPEPSPTLQTLLVTELHLEQQLTNTRLQIDQLKELRFRQFHEKLRRQEEDAKRESEEQEVRRQRSFEKLMGDGVMVRDYEGEMERRVKVKVRRDRECREFMRGCVRVEGEIERQRQTFEQKHRHRLRTRDHGTESKNKKDKEEDDDEKKSDSMLSKLTGWSKTWTSLLDAM